MSRIWTFRDYVADSGENVIRAWIAGLPKPVKAKIQTRITYLETERAFDPLYVKVLHGPCSGLLELRIVYQGNQYRPLCSYGPGTGDITLLMGAIEKGGRFEPRSACSTALARKAKLREPGRTCEHDFS